MDDATLPDGWTVWNEEPAGQLTLAFRPDRFDGSTLPAACMPTITVTRRPPGQRRRRAGQQPTGWHVALFLEPDVRVRDRDSRHDDRETAVDQARDLAAAFTRGAVDVRAAYQVPRPAYLDALEDATG